MMLPTDLENCDEIYQYLIEGLPLAPKELLRELADNWLYEAVDVDPADILSVLNMEGVRSYQVYSFDYAKKADLVELIKRAVPEKVLCEQEFPYVFIVIKSNHFSSSELSLIDKVIDAMNVVFAREAFILRAWYFGVDMGVGWRVQLIFPTMLGDEFF